jgi:hypothetical protein
MFLNFAKFNRKENLERLGKQFSSGTESPITRITKKKHTSYTYTGKTGYFFFGGPALNKLKLM